MQTGTYSDLLERIQGLAGVSAFTTAEETYVESFINRRAYQAYRYSDLWARYIVGAEARPGPTSLIPWEYDETAGVRTVSTATRSGTTVTVVTTTDIDSDFVAGQYVTIAGLSYSTGNPNGSYQVASVSDDDTFTYELTDDTLTGDETYSGTGSVTPAALNDIDTFIRVFGTNPYNVNSAISYDFYVESDGAHIIGNSTSADGFWVCYKKRWEGPYTDGDVIPLEFFNYTAHAAYADFLRMDGQVDKAQAEEASAQQYLMIELDRPQNAANSRLVTRISTHGSAQNRQ
jgi:hypothetical protein